MTFSIDHFLKFPGESLKEDIKSSLLSLFSNQETFYRIHRVDKASVKLSFRIMTEVKTEGNILNSRKYPKPTDNTLNFLLPCHDTAQRIKITKGAKIISSAKDMKALRYFKVIDSYFKVFQTPLKED